MHVGAIVWFVLFSMKKAAALALAAPLSLKYKSLDRGVREGMLTSYVEVVNHCLENYATNYIIAEEGPEIVRFTQLRNMSPLLYVHSLWLRTLHFQQVQDEGVLKGSLCKAYHPQKGTACARFGAIISMPHYRSLHMKPRP